MPKNIFPVYKTKSSRPVFQPTGDIVKADLTEGELGSQIEQEGEKIEGQVGGQLAREAGEHAGRSLTSKPGVELTRQDAVYNQALRQAQKVTIQTNIRNTTQKFKNQYYNSDKFNQSSLSQFQDTYRKYANQLLYQVPDNEEVYTQRLLGYYGGQLQNHLAKKTSQQADFQTQVDAYEYLDQSMQDIQSAAQAGHFDNAKALGGMALQKLNFLHNIKKISPRSYASMKKKIEDSYEDGVANNALSEYIQSPELTKEKREKFKKSDFMKDEPLRKQAILSENIADQNSYQQYESLSHRILRHSQDSALANIANKGDPEKYQSLQERTAQFQPNISDLFQHKINLANLAHKTKLAIEGEPHDSVMDKLSRFAPTEESSKQQRVFFQKFKTIISQDQNERQKDSAKYFLNSKFGKKVVSARDTFPGSPLNKEQPNSLTSADLDQYRMQFYEKMKLAPQYWRMLTREDASNLARKFNQTTLQGRLDLVQNMEKAHPDTFAYWSKELKQAGATANFSVYHNLLHDPEARQYAPLWEAYESQVGSKSKSESSSGTLAEKVMSADNQEILTKLNRDPNFQAWERSIIETMPGDSQHKLLQAQNQMINFYKFIQNYRENIAKVSDKGLPDYMPEQNADAYKDVVSKLFLGTNHTAVTINDKTALLPQTYKGMPLPHEYNELQNVIHAYFHKNIKSAELAIPAHNRFSKDDSQNQSVYKDLLSNNYGVRLTPDQNSLIFIDEANNPIIDKEGNVFKISLDELVNPTSDSYNEAHEHMEENAEDVYQIFSFPAHTGLPL